MFTRSGGGHVAFFLRYVKGDRIEVLGGNQSDQVSVTTRAKSGLIAIRRPPEGPVETITSLAEKDSRIVDSGQKNKKVGGGIAVTGAGGVAIEVVGQATGALQPLKDVLTEYGPWIMIAVLIGSIALGGFIYYQAHRSVKARVEDANTGKTVGVGSDLPPAERQVR